MLDPVSLVVEPGTYGILGGASHSCENTRATCRRRLRLPVMGHATASLNLAVWPDAPTPIVCVHRPTGSPRPRVRRVGPDRSGCAGRCGGAIRSWEAAIGGPSAPPCS